MSLIPPSKANTDSQLLSRPVRPTIVLVHAGWHGPETYSLVVPGLEKAGYSITAVTLPSAGQTPAVPDLSEDVKIIHNTVTSNLRIGKDVVLVMHSFGSISGCEALKGVAEELANDHAHQPPGVKVGKVMKLAFISAKLVPEGEAVWESSRDRPPGFQRVNDMAHITDAPQSLYNDLPSDLADRWNAHIKPQSVHALTSKLTYPAYFHYPTTYLLCTNDRAFPFKLQKLVVAQARIKDTMEVAASHFPQLSQPKVVEKFIRRAAGEAEPML